GLPNAAFGLSALVFAFVARTFYFHEASGNGIHKKMITHPSTPSLTGSELTIKLSGLPNPSRDSIFDVGSFFFMLGTVSCVCNLGAMVLVRDYRQRRKGLPPSPTAPTSDRFPDLLATSSPAGQLQSAVPPASDALSVPQLFASEDAPQLIASPVPSLPISTGIRRNRSLLRDLSDQESTGTRSSNALSFQEPYGDKAGSFLFSTPRAGAQWIVETPEAESYIGRNSQLLGKRIPSFTNLSDDHRDTMSTSDSESGVPFETAP
ncbi:hypothetical protein HDU93_004755, partial [Gonapodya sp. JEL0774]